MQYKHPNTQQDNILNSVEYLIQEAERLGFDGMQLELSRALNSLRTGESEDFYSMLKDLSNKEKLTVFEMLFNFIKSTPESQKKFLDIIEDLPMVAGT